jgi:hypothetical protein
MIPRVMKYFRSRQLLLLTQSLTEEMAAFITLAFFSRFLSVNMSFMISICRFGEIFLKANEEKPSERERTLS